MFFALAVLTVLLPSSAAAERVARDRYAPPGTLELEWRSAPLSAQLLHDDPRIPDAEGRFPEHPALPAAPARLFSGVVAEERCRSPILSADGWGRAALCELGTKKAPAARWVVRGGARIDALPHRPPVGAGPHTFALAQHDATAALIAAEGSTLGVHLLDLRGRTDHQVVGAFTDPTSIRISGDGRTILFVATVGRSRAVLHVELGAPRATILCTGRRVGVASLSDDGKNALVFGEGMGFRQAWLVDLQGGARLDLSGKKGDVVDAALHPTADAALFSSRVGGVCAVYWIDLGLRRRDELVPGVEACFERVGMDGTRRLAWFVAHEKPSRGPERRTVTVFDRKTGGPFTPVPAGCEEPVIDERGRLLAARCGADPGPGTWILPLPEAP